MRSGLIFFLAGLLTASSLVAGAPPVGPSLAADLGDRVPWPWAITAPPVSVALGDEVFFLHDDGLHGTELWASDGTAPGTRLVIDLCPGRCGIERGSVTHAALDASSSHILFAGNDGISGHEPWLSDGTAAGTFQLGDLRPGPDGSDPWYVTAFPGGFAFTAVDAAHGRELWVSDGSPAGTRLLADLRAGPASSSITVIEWIGDRFFVNSAGGPTAGVHLVTLDGSVTDLGVIPGQSLHQAFSRRPIALPDGDLLFVAPAGSSGALWRLDAETYSLSAIAGPDLPGPVPAGAVLTGFAGGAVVGVQGEHGGLLGYTDGVGLTVEAGAPGITTGGPLAPLAAVVGTQLVFAGSAAGEGLEPWVWSLDTGHLQLADIVPGPDPSLGYFYYDGFCFLCQLPFVHEVAGRALLAVDDPDEGRSLWTSDGTPAGTTFLSALGAEGPEGYVTEQYFGGGSQARLGDGSLLIPVWQDDGIDLWRTDATPGGTGLVTRIASGTDAFRPPASYFGSQFTQRIFTHLVSRGRVVAQVFSQPFPGPEVSWWLLDGQSATPLAPSSAVSWGWAVDHQGSVVVAAAELSQGNTVHRLWSLAPDASALEPIEDLPAAGWVDWLHSDGGWLWYREADSGDVVRTDLTPAGTTVFPAANAWALVPGPLGMLAVGNTATILPWGQGQATQVADATGPLAPIYPANAARVGSGFVIGANREGLGTELWFTDGSVDGTRLVRDIAPGPADGVPTLPWTSRELPRIARFGEEVVFLADDGLTGAEPWITDGATADRLADLRPGPLGSWPQDFHSVGSRTVFVADNGTHGREVFVLDPTFDGSLVVDLLPGPQSSRPEVLAVRNPFVYVAAWEPAFGRELWRLNLRDRSLERLTDLVPGPGSSSPTAVAISGRTLWIVAHDGVHGLELFTLDDPALVIFEDGFESGTTGAWS